MQLEVGKIYEGKVTGITKFGAFVELDKETTGMVHISEVANTFVNEIKDHIQEGQMVKVKVLSVGDDGKIGLSIKKAMDNPRPQKKSFNNKREGNGNSRNFEKRPYEKKPYEKRPYEKRQFEQKKAAPVTPESQFEDMLSKFKQKSEEKMSDLKKNMDGKRRNTSRRSGPKI